MTLNEYQLKPVLTANGRRGCQSCFVCSKQIDFLKTPQHMRVIVGALVRHKRCLLPFDRREHDR